MSTTVTTPGTEVYAIDPAHAGAEFVVRHLMISKVRGRFSSLEGTISLAPGSDLPQSVEVKIDPDSIDTREKQRDAHLRSADFLHVENYPEMTFRSVRVEGTPESFKVHGDLTIHGTTRPVILEGAFEGKTIDPWGNHRVGYSAETKISRKDFGLTWNQVLETGGVAVGDEVRIELNVEATRK